MDTRGGWRTPKKIKLLLTKLGKIEDTDKSGLVAVHRLFKLASTDHDEDVTRDRMNLLVNTKVALKRYFEQEGAFGFLKDTSQAKYFLRIQQQGNCFMNAPAVFFAYILQFLDLYEDGVHGAVDVAKFIRRSFTDPELYDYVREGSGGNADAVLKTILKPLLGFDATTTGIRPRNAMQAS
ncbi:expressed unknown protein [Seminavis robusta]|uniref:Uncharacterized protein n=1 Tax=Seminavis robusta TaxID=568900 RepID=A0A9N8DVX2_9STRA|nr:expressed unknown protein [Seminavis robusta]|eukprot:Sro334_g119740.1 n/a (180) ;mRNA; f:25685-26345